MAQAAAATRADRDAEGEDGDEGEGEGEDAGPAARPGGHVHFEVEHETEDLVAGIKAPNVTGVQLDALVKAARGPEWDVMYAQSLAKGAQDVFVAAKGPEKLEAVRVVARAGKISKRSLWMVHGKVDEAALDLLRETHQNSTDSIHELRVARHFRSHSAEGGWLSIIEARWSAFQQAAIKASLQKIGHPLVGHGRCTVRLRARGFRGNKIATCGLEFSLPDGTHVAFSRISEVLARYELLGAREEAAWEAKTRRREEDLIRQGVDPERARLIAEERDPLSHATGRQVFAGLEFAVTPAVFSPFQGSVSIVESLADALAESDEQGGSGGAVLDLGVGSGCLLLTMLKGHLAADWKGYGVDISADAVAATAANAASLGLADRCVLRQCDYAEVPDPFLAKGAQEGEPEVLFSAVLCNPPYLPDNVASSMAVLRNVPRAGFSGGEDGLQGYRAVSSFFARTRSVRDNAIVAIEVSGNFSKRHEQVKEVLQASGRLSFMRDGKPDNLGQHRCLLFRVSHAADY